MRKINNKLFLVILLLAITGCNSSSKWNNEPENLPAELKSEWLQTIDENKVKLSTVEEDDKIDVLFLIARTYDSLGNYRNAIKYYKQVLELGPHHFPALNNAAAIYEQVGEYDKSAELIKRLYETHPDNTQVIIDVVRILLKNKEPELAQAALENFQKVTGDKESPELISELYQSIFDYKKSNE